jgi:hypothetical protein
MELIVLEERAETKSAQSTGMTAKGCAYMT